MVRNCSCNLRKSFLATLTHQCWDLSPGILITWLVLIPRAWPQRAAGPGELELYPDSQLGEVQLGGGKGSKRLMEDPGLPGVKRRETRASLSCRCGTDGAERVDGAEGELAYRQRCIILSVKTRLQGPKHLPHGAVGIFGTCSSTKFASGCCLWSLHLI